MAQWPTDDSDEDLDLLPPVFKPDPDLIDHLEGDVPELKSYVEHARRSLAEGEREEARRARVAAARAARPR